MLGAKVCPHQAQVIIDFHFLPLCVCVTRALGACALCLRRWDPSPRSGTLRKPQTKRAAVVERSSEASGARWSPTSLTPTHRESNTMTKSRLGVVRFHGLVWARGILPVGFAFDNGATRRWPSGLAGAGWLPDGARSTAKP